MILRWQPNGNIISSSLGCEDTTSFLELELYTYTTLLFLWIFILYKQQLCPESSRWNPIASDGLIDVEQKENCGIVVPTCFLNS